MTDSEREKCVDVLLEKAAQEKVAVNILQISQAACNAANAIAQLQHVQQQRK